MKALESETERFGEKGRDKQTETKTKRKRIGMQRDNYSQKKC